MREELQTIIEGFGLRGKAALIAEDALIGIALVILCLAADRFARRVLLMLITRMVRKTRSTWDDRLVERRVFKRLAHLVPALLIYRLMPTAFPARDLLVPFVQDAALMYLIVMSMLVADSLIDFFHDLYHATPLERTFPLKGVLQATVILLWIVTVMLVLSVITGQSPLYFLSGIGALTAVMLLIFRDALLGLVAGVQLSVNRMVATGDWIEMPQYGADGDVIDVSLTTVKVQNWDKTISSIPAYALISSSFKNWRGMQESGGRRIKRAIHIDMNSIQFCDAEMIERFRKIQFLSAYVDRKLDELKLYNAEHGVDETSMVNGRRMTNVGTFRAYVEAYLRNHPLIHKDMTFLVRQLAPGEHGLPLEIYVFTTDTRWANYEAIQANIFDHLLAALPEFGLRVYQSPSGADFRTLASH